MRYIDELPDGARTQFVAQREAAMHGDRAAQAFFTALDGSYWGASPADLFDAVALGIARDHRGTTLAKAAIAIMALFGEDMPYVVRLCAEVHEEIETLKASRLSRIVRRILDHRSSQADLTWLLVQAEAMTDDLILTASPFEGDQDGAVELRRQVVRARKPWTCHWTRRPIAVGERHLAITERYDGKVLTTRHSLLSVYLDVAGEDPAAAIELAPGRAPEGGMRDIREHRDEVLSRMAEGPIHTRYHAVNEALVERQERLQTEGNRKARRAAAAKAATAHIQDEHERMLRLVLAILYDERLSAEERVARAGNAPGFDPVRDGRPYLPWPPRSKAADLPAVGSFHG